jgi:hypothetical protein
MTIIICPGIHSPDLTESFLSGLLEVATDKSTNRNSVDIRTFEAEGCLALSGFHILDFIQESIRHKVVSPIVFISYSAGVVGAIHAAYMWQLLGGQIKALIAIDGWGVPLWGNFPIHRMSHDYFTHWSSCLIGSGEDNYYADPPVDHIDMWRVPQNVQGWWINSSTLKSPPNQRVTAAEFLYALIRRYEEI